MPTPGERRVGSEWRADEHTVMDMQLPFNLFPKIIHAIFLSIKIPFTACS